MSDPRFAWRRASRGLYFIGLGTFLLLTTLGFLPWSYWWELLAWWPVILIALGLRIVFQRSRLPWLVLLSPVVVLGTMTLVAVAGPPRLLGPSEGVTLARPPQAERLRLEGSLALAKLDLVARRDLPDLLRGDVRGGRARPSLRVGGRDTEPAIRLRNLHDHVVFFRGGWEGALTADMAADLPLTVDLDLVMLRGTLDLAEADVRRVDLDGVFQDLTLILPAPEDDVTVSLEGVFNRLTLVVPPDTPVRVRESGFLNPVDGRHAARSLDGPGYRLYIDGFSNWVEVTSD